MAAVMLISCSRDDSLGDNGNGTIKSPYIISTPEQLHAMRNNPSAHYKLGSNIDLTNYLKDDGAYAGLSSGWNPIMAFSGSFDGAGYKITGLRINLHNNDHVGLFAEVKGGSVQNLGVEMANAGILGRRFVGGVAGILSDNGSITNCYVTGKVIGVDYVGGVAGGVGSNMGFVDYGSITNCYVTGNVSGTLCVGGVAGFIYGGSITSCYSTGTISGNSHVGGVVGVVGSHGNGGKITNCVALNSGVSGNSSVGRITGAANTGYTLLNNWARIMTVTENGMPKKPLFLLLMMR